MEHIILHLTEVTTGGNLPESEACRKKAELRSNRHWVLVNLLMTLLEGILGISQWNEPTGSLSFEDSLSYGLFVKEP